MLGGGGAEGERESEVDCPLGMEGTQGWIPQPELKSTVQAQPTETPRRPLSVFYIEYLLCILNTKTHPPPPFLECELSKLFRTLQPSCLLLHFLTPGLRRAGQASRGDLNEKCFPSVISQDQTSSAIGILDSTPSPLDLPPREYFQYLQDFNSK